MLKRFLKQLERRRPLGDLLSEFPDVLEAQEGGRFALTDKGFQELSTILDKSETSFRSLALQAGVRWATTSSQKVALRHFIQQTDFVTPMCLWAHAQVRGSVQTLYKEYSAPETAFMQILLLKETDPAQSIPFLIERFLNRKDLSDELRGAARLCILRLMDAGISPELASSLQRRFPTLEILRQWRPSLPACRDQGFSPLASDFHTLVRSVRDVRELASFTRVLYLLSCFYVPLTAKEWGALQLSKSDELFFKSLTRAGMIESVGNGMILTSDQSKNSLAQRFLFDTYPFVKESVLRVKQERQREEREHRVRTSELDRQALEMISDGIVCIEKSGFLYYMNSAADKMLGAHHMLRERIFGPGPLEQGVRRYSQERALERMAAYAESGEVEIFGARVTCNFGERRFQIELGPQIILIRDVSDLAVIDREIGKLYRHELKAALDVIGAGIETVRDIITDGDVSDALPCLDQIEQKRAELFVMLEERISFIRLHSDCFKVRRDPVNLNLVIDKCLSNHRDAAGVKRIAIKSNHLHAEGIFALGEESYILRAVDNVVRNAVKFCPPGAEIRIELESDGGHCRIKIEDNGPGIPREHMGKLFQLGFTTNGSGRGLYMTRRIAQAHGGRVDVRSKPGQGALFTFTLPSGPDEFAAAREALRKAAL